MDIEFRLPDPAFEAYTWAYDREHNWSSHPPLTLWMPGMEGAGGEALPGNLKINGYSYWRVGAIPAFAARRREEGPRLPPLQDWRERWLPRVERHLEELQTFEPAWVQPGQWKTVLDAQQRESGRIMAGVHAGPLHRAWQAAEAFREAYTAHFGEERAGDALELLQGFEHATALRAIALEDLARLGDTGEGLDAEAIGRFLDCWGQTIEGGVQDRPSWAEDPAPVVASVLAQWGSPRGAGPRARHQATIARRQHLESELHAAAEGSPGAARAQELLAAGQEYVVVLEDHNVLCDQRLNAASRARWLAVGQHVAGPGAPRDAADDVFYYDYPDLLAELEGGDALPAAEISRRRERQAAWRAATPPPFLGRLPDEERKQEAGRAGVVRGRGASKGVYRGRARVVSSLEEAWALQPGEVLVCAVTSPSWTPLFGIAGAVVTGAGGVLSHAAVVAREFGIPAVVGCGEGLGAIPHGAEVEVDGGGGTVRVVG